MKYSRKENALVVRLFKGEELIQAVKQVCAQENITSGRVQAIGAVKAVLGYFDAREKKYIHYECEGELASCMGNIAKKEDDLVVHAHAVVADREGICKGGHIVTAETSVTVELFIDAIPGLARTLDKETGLYLLDL